MLSQFILLRFKYVFQNYLGRSVKRTKNANVDSPEGQGHWLIYEKQFGPRSKLLQPGINVFQLI